MEYYREYINNALYKKTVDTLDSVKIVTIKRNTTPFIIYSSNVLNSQKLFNLLDLHDLTPEDLMRILNEHNHNKIKQQLLNASYLLKEDILFHSFDLCNNFLMHGALADNKCDMDNIIKLIKNNHDDTAFSKNYINYVNPYKIERVVFSGGGSKGMIYLGVLLGLLLSGNIFYLNYFSGTSIGALTATVLAVITPAGDIYDNLKNTSLKNILKNTELVEKYTKSINFVIERFISRPLDSFYTTPKFTVSSVYDTIKKMLYNNYLYDFEDSGYSVWLALICKHICNTMGNNLDKLIIIKDRNGSFINVDEVDYDEDYSGWKVERFFTFDEYSSLTGKTIVMTGTNWNPIDTVYYSNNPSYKDLTVIKACSASSCIPCLFKPIVINGTNNLDGGMFENYPLTFGDKKIGNRITEYHNKTVGFLIDDQHSAIEPYEIIREIWLLYNGFIDGLAISYLMESEKYTQIMELFFEIRLELFKLLYAPNAELKQFIYTDHSLIFEELAAHRDTDDRFRQFKLKLPHLRSVLTEMVYEDGEFKIGKMTDLDDIYNSIFKQGYYHNILNNVIDHDILIINSLEMTELKSLPIISKYRDLLETVNHILSYYELKGLFYFDRNIQSVGKSFISIILQLKENIVSLSEITEAELYLMNKPKNYIRNMIDIANTTIHKILTRVTGKDHMIKKNETYFNRIINKIYSSNISDIIYKYTCIANDRICMDTMNNMRTVKLNTFETNLLQFEIDSDLVSRLLYEGFSKTIKHYVNILRIMEITGIDKSDAEYIESYEQKYKKIIRSP